MFAKLHLVGTLAPLIIPNFFGDAFSIFLLRQFLLTIPQEYVDAARVDGAGEWRILREDRRPAGQAGHRRGGALQLPLRLERLLRSAPVRRRELQRLDGVRGSGQPARPAPRAVEPDHGRDRALHAAGHRALLRRAEGLRPRASRSPGSSDEGRRRRRRLDVHARAGLRVRRAQDCAAGRPSWCCSTRTSDRLDVVGAFAPGSWTTATGPAGSPSPATSAAALDGADAVLIQLRVGGQQARLHDETVPLACGCLGQETTGAGGLAKALRTVPVVLDLADEVEPPRRSRTRGSSTSPTRSASSPARCATPGTARSACATWRSACSGSPPGCSASSRERVLVDQVGLNHLTWIRRVVRRRRRTVLPELLDRAPDCAAPSTLELPAELIRELGAAPVATTCATSTATTRWSTSCGPGAASAGRCSGSRRSCSSSTATPSWSTKPALLEQRGGAYYSEAAVALLTSLVTGDGAVHEVDVPNAGTADRPGRRRPGRGARPTVDRDGAHPLPQPPLAPELLGLVQHVAAYERLAVAAAALSGEPRRRTPGAAGPSARRSMGPGRELARVLPYAMVAEPPGATGGAVARGRRRQLQDRRGPVSTRPGRCSSAGARPDLRTDPRRAGRLDGRASTGLVGARPCAARRRRPDRPARPDGRRVRPGGCRPPARGAGAARGRDRRGGSSARVVRNDAFALLRSGTDRAWGVAVVCGAGINCVGVGPDGVGRPVPRTWRHLG